MNLLRTGLITTTLLIVLALASVQATTPPTNEKHDVILLKDGGIARGRIIEMVCDDYVTLQVLEGKTVRIDYNDIRLITDKEHYDNSKGKLRGGCVKDRKIDYEHIVRVGLLRAESSTHLAGEFVMGPRVSRNFFCGMGVGWESLADDLISARLHVYFLKDLVVDGDSAAEFFLHLAGGYAYNLASGPQVPGRGGSTYMLTLGSAFDVGGGTALLVEVGYSYQNFREYRPNDVRSDLAIFSLGVRF